MNNYAQSIRWFAFFIGIAVMAFGIVLMIRADLGTAPWDVLHIGLQLKLGLTVGSWSIIVGFFILAVSSILMKSWPKLGAFLNMLFVGIFIDLFLFLPFIVTPSFLVSKIMMLIIGVFICGIGMGLYISSDHGAGPRDSLMLALTELMDTKIQHVRLAMEIAVLIVGWSLGGPVFIGTLIVTVLIGPTVGYTLPFFRKRIKRMLERGAKSENLDEGKIRPHHYDGIS